MRGSRLNTALSPAGKPFFAVFNLTVTHESQIRASDERHAKNTRRLTPEQRQDPGRIVPPPYHPQHADRSSRLGSLS